METCDGGREGEGDGREGKQTHTLVGHHQVRKTLRENKSTVSTKKGIMGKGVCLFCLTDTQASPEGGDAHSTEVRGV